LEMGRCFIRIKAHEDHGRFLKAIENVGMTPRSAQYSMLAAQKFSNTKAISHLSSTKMIVLSVLDEDDVQTLEDGGNIAGMSIDDIDRMSTRELKEKLREERKHYQKAIENREKAIKQKEQKINELDEQLRYQQPPTKEQLAQAGLNNCVKDYRDTLLEAVSGLSKANTLLNQKIANIEGIDVQMVNEWLNQFNLEMELMSKAFKELTDFIDEPYLPKLYKK